MNILLAAVNAKYIHSNPAVYSLKAWALNQGAAREEEIQLGEYTINQPAEQVLQDIYRRNPQVVGFSCYIWNISFVLQTARDLARVLPQTSIWLGGPEVSFDSRQLLAREPEINGIMRGEGEETFARLIQVLRQAETLAGPELDEAFKKVEGLTFRAQDGTIQENPDRPEMDFSRLPFSYGILGTQNLKNRIIYYESSRGCPFSCSYCLSSLDRKLRFRTPKQVKQELQFFLDLQVPQVKFIDRTFNCSKSHAMNIWNYILEHDNGVTNFHFEIGADLLDQEELDLLGRMRPGLVQLEIGVQSTNPLTLEAIRRRTDIEKIRRACQVLEQGQNVHCHLDLIAGLPMEDLESFRRSFNQVYAMKPHQLQLGFLKVLKGSFMEARAGDYGLVWSAHPPYEVLSTRWISYDGLLELKQVEEMVEIYYNSGQFTATLELLEQEFDSPFQMFLAMGNFYRSRGYDRLSHSRLARYQILWEMIGQLPGADPESFRDRLGMDLYLREYLKTRPDFLRDQSPWREQIREFFLLEEKHRRYLPDYEGRDARQLAKMARLEVLKDQSMVLFDYRHRDALRGNARTVFFRPGILNHVEEAFL